MHNHPVPRRIRCVTNPDPNPASGGTPATEPKPSDPKPADPKAGRSDESKEFSRALAKRAAEIEARYADYDEIKSKAAKLDEIEEAKKSEIDKLREQAEQAAKERDELKAAHERELLLGSIADDTGLSREVVALLAGEGDALKANAQKLQEAIGEITEKQQGTKPKLPPANPPTAGGDLCRMSPAQLLAAAYADQ